jgi:hypothetical protein
MVDGRTPELTIPVARFPAVVVPLGVPQVRELLNHV